MPEDCPDGTARSSVDTVTGILRGMRKAVTITQDTTGVDPTQIDMSAGVCLHEISDSRE